MEKLKINSNEANTLIKNLLEKYYDYDITNITVDPYFNYLIESNNYHDGHIEKNLILLSKIQYLSLLKTALNFKGYNLSFIEPIIKNGIISYKLNFNIIEKYSRKRKRG